MSHYLPYFTIENGTKRQAACGAWIEPSEAVAREHEPTCDKCLVYVLAERETDGQSVEDVFGDAPPHGSNVRAFEPFDVTGGRPREVR